MFRVSQHPSSGVLKTVSATSGIGHDAGSATSFHRGLIRTFLLTLNHDAQNHELKKILVIIFRGHMALSDAPEKIPSDLGSIPGPPPNSSAVP